MKKFVLVLLLIIGIETWGIVGAAQTERIMYTCTLEIGPLCYLWEESSVGKVLGLERSKQLEESMLKAKQTWEKEFIDKSMKGDGLEKSIKAAGEGLKEGLETAKDVVEENVEKLEKMK